MSHALTRNVTKMLSLFAEIQQCACYLHPEEDEVIYLFFVAKMALADVSYVCDLAEEQICGVIISFLNDLFTRSGEFKTLLVSIVRSYDIKNSSLHMLRQEARSKLITRICHLPADDTEDSCEARIREVIGIGLDVPVAKIRKGHHDGAYSGAIAHP